MPEPVAHVNGTSPPDTGSASRRPYIDWARGIAVLIMIAAHALDAWTRASDRSTSAFGYLLLLGGFAAPMFLWLAGLGLVLSAEQILNRTGRRSAAAEAIVSRGLEIFILAFLFRLQAFIISPGSWPVTIFRVDILNIMGPAIAAAGLVWSISRGRLQAAVATAAVAAAIAMVTPVIRVAGWVNALPLWVQWYLRPSADHTTFTLFPWAGFVFAGAACGSVLAVRGSEREEQRTLLLLTLTATVVLAAGFYTASLPSIYEVSSFWTSSPTYFAIRVGVLMLVLAALYALTPLAGVLPRVFAVLERFGRNSLFIYWIHVELVYGYVTWVIHGRLPLPAVALAYVLFCGLMNLAVLKRDQAVARWRARRSRKSATAQPVTAQV